MRGWWFWLAAACNSGTDTVAPSDTTSPEPFVGCLLVLNEMDDGADGVIDRSISFTHDDAGHLISSVDHRAGVTPDAVETLTWDGDDNIRQEADDSGDGLPEFQRDRTYDGAHQVLTERTRTFDPVTRETTADTECASSWDSDGHNTRVECTGSGTITFTYTWDGDLQIESTTDVGSDGAVEATIRTTYDDAGREVEVEQLDVSGAVVRLVETEWAEDGSSAVVTVQTPPYVIEVQTWTFDEGGRPLTGEFDWSGDGSVDVVATYAYDDAGRELVSREEHAGGYVGEWRSTYDERGNLIVTEQEFDGDPEPDHRTTLTWACTP